MLIYDDRLFLALINHVIKIEVKLEWSRNLAFKKN